MYPNKRFSFGFTPIGAPAIAASGPAAPFVAIGVTGLQLTSSLWSKLSPPRGEYQKFQRTAYPMMSRQASSTGLPVDCFWFGEVVRVFPDGKFGVTKGQCSYADALQYERSLALTEKFYYMVCTDAKIPSSGDIPGCKFVFMGDEMISKDIYTPEPPGVVTFNRDAYASQVVSGLNRLTAVDKATPGSVQEEKERGASITIILVLIVLAIVFFGGGK